MKTSIRYPLLLILLLLAACQSDSSRLTRDQAETSETSVPIVRALPLPTQPAAPTPVALESAASVTPTQNVPATAAVEDVVIPAATGIATIAAVATRVVAPPELTLALSPDLESIVRAILDEVTDSAWTWRLLPTSDPAAELAAGNVDLAIVAGEGGLSLGARSLVAAVPFTTDWEYIDLATAQRIAANGHSLVQTLFWDELRPPLRALRVNGLHPTDQAYPFQQPYVLQSSPDHETAAASLAPFLAEAFADNELLQIAAVGDINMDRALGAIVAGGRIEFPFSQVSSHLQSADITVGNLECALGNKGEPQNKSYAFRAPPEAAQSLAGAGFDVITLANNHALDYGPEALMQGIELLEEQQMATIGAGVNAAAARSPAFIERNGLTLAFLGYVQVPIEGRPPYFDTQTWTATAETPGLAWAEPDEVAADVAAARLQSDVVVVVLHSGVEYVSAPSPEQMAAARAAIDAGAALVIGHHAHILQGVEFYNGGVIVYGLANFAFNIIGPPETAILKAWLDADGVRAIEFIPAILQENGQPRLANDEEAAAIRQSLYNMSGGLVR